MLMKDRFKLLMPQVASIKRYAPDGSTIFWKIFDESGQCLGYAFYVKVPETNDPSLDIAEFDIYEVLCILDFDYRVAALDICAHPEGPERLWAQGIIEDEFKAQYMERSAQDIHLSPEGSIDAVSDGTISSQLVTTAIRERVLQIRDIVQAEDNLGKGAGAGCS
jgi:hypothetical protein